MTDTVCLSDRSESDGRRIQRLAKLQSRKITTGGQGIIYNAISFFVLDLRATATQTANCAMLKFLVRWWVTGEPKHGWDFEVGILNFVLILELDKRTSLEKSSMLSTAIFLCAFFEFLY